MIEKLEKEINGRAVYRVPERFYTFQTARDQDSAYCFFLTDSLEKVFPTRRPRELSPQTLRVLPGEVPAVQLVYYYRPGKEYKYLMPEFTVCVEGAPVPARMRSVELVASDYPAGELADSDYITTEPGLFPDLLMPMPTGKFSPVQAQYRAVWIDFPGIAPEHAGRHTVRVCVEPDEAMEAMGLLVEVPGREQKRACLSFEMCVLPTALPAQTLLHTEWFHPDSLADYYGVPVFSDAHWAQIERFIEMAAREHAVNMLLTPIFTPPLNTGFGLERTTVQLVDVRLENGEYRFGFDKLHRWCGICKRYGITHLEIAHFFTQWGATATPKIVADTPEGQRRIFGWHVAATDPAYRRFLSALLPALCQELRQQGYDAQHVRFHISDEPFAALGHEQSYRAARHVLDGLLDGYVIMDALSDYALYEQGILQHPVPTNDRFQEFYDKGFDDPWVYYCAAQANKVPNRFMAMPSARSRIMGVLMYVYGIKGFLHWGYNYYSDRYATQRLNPFWQTSSGRCFPSGDAYLVYPGEGGVPLSSIRAEVVRSAFDDVRALQLLERTVGRQGVLEIVQEVMGELTFFHYPQDAAALQALHDRLFQELAKNCG